MNKKVYDISIAFIGVLLIVILMFGLLQIYIHLYNKIITKEQSQCSQEGVIRMSYSPEFRFKALCPFNCVDMGFEGGYYTNLGEKCVCRRKE